MIKVKITSVTDTLVFRVQQYVELRIIILVYILGFTLEGPVAYNVKELSLESQRIHNLNDVQ